MKQASVLQKVDQLDPTVTPMSDIFEMAIINGAKAAGFDRLGKLSPGWRADIIGLSTDSARGTPLYEMLSYLVFAARGEDVQFTMVDGEVLIEDGIRQAATAVAKSLDIQMNERARKNRSPDSAHRSRVDRSGFQAFRLRFSQPVSIETSSDFCPLH